MAEFDFLALWWNFQLHFIPTYTFTILFIEVQKLI